LACLLRPAVGGKFEVAQSPKCGRHQYISYNNLVKHILNNIGE
jgi:hypothetical protein